MNAQITVAKLEKIKNSIVSGILILNTSSKIYDLSGVHDEDNLLYNINKCDTSKWVESLIYAILSSTCGTKPSHVFETKDKFPYFKFNEQQENQQAAIYIKILKDYFSVIKRANKRVPKIIDKCKDLSRSVINFKETAKEDIKNQPNFSPEKAKDALLSNIWIIKKIKQVGKVVICITSFWNKSNLSLVVKWYQSTYQ